MSFLTDCGVHPPSYSTGIGVKTAVGNTDHASPSAAFNAFWRGRGAAYLSDAVSCAGIDSPLITVHTTRQYNIHKKHYIYQPGMQQRE